MLSSVQNGWDGRLASSGVAGSEYFKNVCFRCIWNPSASCEEARPFSKNEKSPRWTFKCFPRGSEALTLKNFTNFHHF